MGKHIYVKQGPKQRLVRTAGGFLAVVTDFNHDEEQDCDSIVTAVLVGVLSVLLTVAFMCF